MNGKVARARLALSDSDFWRSGLERRLTEVPGFAGVHSSHPYEDGYVYNVHGPVWELPSGEYMLIVELTDERYTFYFSSPEGLWEARKILQ